MKLNDTPKEWLESYNDNIDFYNPDEKYPFTAMNQGSKCCPDKHPTFYGAILKSPQWQEWYKEQQRRFHEPITEAVFDIDESEGIGAIGDNHLQEFFKFIVSQYKKSLVEDLRKEFENKSGWYYVPDYYQDEALQEAYEHGACDILSSFEKRVEALISKEEER